MSSQYHNGSGRRPSITREKDRENLTLWKNEELKLSLDCHWTLRRVTDGMPLMPRGTGEEATFSTPGRSDSFKKANIWQLPFDLIATKKRKIQNKEI